MSRLLLDHLKSRLAPIKESQLYFGEWKTTHWTDEMLEPFFAGRGEVPSLESAIAIRRFRSSVPSTIEDAVQRRYKIEQFPLWQLLNPLDTIFRTDIKAMFTRRRHGA